MLQMGRNLVDEQGGVLAGKKYVAQLPQVVFFSGATALL